MARHKSSSSLSLYRHKRDFKKTAEPRGKKAKAGHALTYMIQKHAARRLHYDFRLELDGTLKSWAVTRGPSLNPADKRLAVHVEDHPLDYATFEGTIPQGQYGGGTVMLWDRGTWEAVGDPHKSYAKGRLTFVLHGTRLKGEWHLVRMGGKAQQDKRENWLLIKSHDQYANQRDGDYAIEHYRTSVVSGRSMEKIAKGRKQWISNRAQDKPLSEKTIKQKAVASLRQKRPAKKSRLALPPDFVAPQLATLVTDPPDGGGWMHEIKFDGYRALCRINGNDVRLLTRANNDWTQKFRGVAEDMRGFKIDNALLDGEIVTIAEDGSMSFGALQKALSKGQKEKLHYYLFDALFLNGEDLRDQTLLQRKQILREIVPKDHATIHYSEHFNDPGGKVLQHACHIALEGIVSKRADASYRSGRSDAWLKSKCTNEQEFVIGGFTCQPRHPGRLGALLIGYYEGKQLNFACKVGTGFSYEEANRLIKKFRPLKQKNSPFHSIPASERQHTSWLKPELVAQVAFAEWTEGGALRHPSFQGLREDKPANQVVREKKKKLFGAHRPLKHTKTQEGSVSVKPNIVAGVTLTHPDKILYHDQNLTKRDLADYYAEIADWMLPHVAGRPISLVRCPEGDGKPCFFQRHSGEGLSEYIKPVKINIKDGEKPFLTINDVRGLMAIVQMGVLEIHIWGARADKPDLPDRIVFDLDPAEDVPWKKVQAAAVEIRERLKKLKLESFLKTTGGKGLHIVAPIMRKLDWKTVKAFTRAMAEQMAHDAPENFTTNIRKAERKGRIFIDYLRNDKTASAIAPYSTRARPGVPVAVPLLWKELAGLKNGHSFTMESVLQRRKKIKDPWQDMEKTRQSIPL